MDDRTDRTVDASEVVAESDVAGEPHLGREVGGDRVRMSPGSQVRSRDRPDRPGRPPGSPATRCQVQVVASSVRAQHALRGWPGDPHACRGLDPRRRPEPGAGLVRRSRRRQRPAAGALESQRRPRTPRACSRSRADRRPRSPTGRHAGLRARRGRPARPGSGLRDGLRRLGRLLRRPSPSSVRRPPAGSPTKGSASTCAPAASWPWPCGPESTRARSACTATTRATRSWSCPGGRRRSDHRRLLRRDRADRSAGRRPRLDERPRSWCGSPPGWRRTPTVHRHRARGPEIRLLDRRRAGPGRPARGPRRAIAGARRHPLPHRLADLRRRRLPRRRSPDAAAARHVRRETGVELPEIDLGGGFGIAYTSTDTPATPADLAAAMRRIVEPSAPRTGWRSRTCRSSPAGRSAVRARSRSTRSARSSRSTSTATPSGRTWPWTAG